MARILILSLIFRPDNVSTAQIMGDLALDLKARGHDILVISTVPHFNEDVEALATQPLSTYWGGVIQTSNYHGIEVLHVWMPRKGKSKLVRIIAWLGFHVVSTVAGVLIKFKPDIILAPSPPLTIGVSAWLLGLWHKCPFVYNVQEIYPDVAVNLGVLKSKSIIKSLQRVERLVYDKAKALTIISSGMAENISQKIVAKEKIFIIPNFVDMDEFRPLPKINYFSICHQLHDKFVVSYAGNMGVPQRLDILIEAAHLLRNKKNIHFLMMGDGSECSSLKNKANDLRLTNITFLSYQPYSLMAQAYAAVDASFVSQASGTSNDGIPSKVYRIMACARPVIVCTDKDSDLAKLIMEADGGTVVGPRDVLGLTGTIKNAFLDRYQWAQKGQNARQFVLERYSRSSVSEKYHRLLTSLVSDASAGVIL